MRHAARQLPSWLIFDVRQMKQERTRGFYFDALRISFAIARRTHNRLWHTLAEIEPQFSATGTYDELIASAFSDVWTMVDVLHRVREIAQQFTVLPKRSAEKELFVRGTGDVEQLRHHVQHLRTEIPKLPDISHPLFGSVAWVSAKEPQKCFSIWSGSLLQGIQTYSCTYDRFARCYVQKLLLCSAGFSFDLEDAVRKLFAFEEALRGSSQEVEKILGMALGLAYTVEVKRENA